jgi:hypothetical protein
VSERVARLCLALVVCGLCAAALSTDLARQSRGTFWGDGATYYTAAWSLVEDGDLRWEARDALRVRREFAQGAQGVFLKRSAGGLQIGGGFPWVHRVPEDKPLVYFAKPLTYPVMAAPFVRMFGTKGLLLANALALGLAIVLGFLELRRQTTPGRALAVAAVLVLPTVAPAYLFWPTPEATNLGVLALALFAWRRGYVAASAILFGIATYSKPPNVLIAAPLGLLPLFTPGKALAQRVLEVFRRGAMVLGSAALLYGVNMAVTGEWNYQGGRERKTFYGVLPYERQGVTFGNSGIWMSTNKVGPRVEGKDDIALSQGAEPPRSASELRQSFRYNLGYFWTGRFGGLLAYFLPFGIAVLVFLVLGPRSLPGALALVAFGLSWIAYIGQIPDNWYGGSGTLGNRYFLNVLPLAAYLVPRGREALVAVSGLLGLAFTAPMLLHPVRHAMDPGEHTKHGLFRRLPAELTMLNDLSIFGEPWRKKRPVGDTEGDPRTPGSADPSAYYLYFSDDGAFGREEHDGATGFWLRGGAPGEILLRALEPIGRLVVRVTGGPAGDLVRVGVDGVTQVARVDEAESLDLVFTPPRGFAYKDTFVHVLKLRSSRGAPLPGGDGRVLGAFITMRLEVVPRRPR